jgi:Tubulin-tyrosine ligase family
MCFEVLGFDIYLDKKARPWLLEVNLAPSFATDSKLDHELKHGVISDTFRLLGVTYREKIRKINKKKEDLQRRIVEKTSYKESLQRNREELELIKAKKEKYENKHMGKFRRIFPSR